jgi:hypothetical protein
MKGVWGEGSSAGRAWKVENMRAKLEQAVLLSPAFVPPSHCHPSTLQSDIIFQDLEKLKSRPAHLAVFLRYIFSQADPSPLVSQKYQSCLSACLCLVENLWPLHLIPRCLDAEVRFTSIVGHLKDR